MNRNVKGGVFNDSEMKTPERKNGSCKTPVSRLVLHSWAGTSDGIGVLGRYINRMDESGQL